MTTHKVVHFLDRVQDACRHYRNTCRHWEYLVAEGMDEETAKLMSGYIPAGDVIIDLIDEASDTHPKAFFESLDLVWESGYVPGSIAFLFPPLLGIA